MSRNHGSAVQGTRSRLLGSLIREFPCGQWRSAVRFPSEMTAARKHRMEIGEDPKFHEVAWHIQRIGKIGMGLLLLAGCLGLLGGGGPFSEVTRHSGSLALRFDRAVRYATPTQMEVTFRSSSDSEWTLHMDRGFLQRVRIDHMLPEPRAVEMTAHAYVFTFSGQTPAGGSSLRISYTPHAAGELAGWISTGENRITFRQWSLP